MKAALGPRASSGYEEARGGMIPLFCRKSGVFPLWDGQAATITVLWMTAPRWASCPEAKPGSRWTPFTFGLVVVAIKVEW